MNKKVLVEVSARHLHLCEAHQGILFGKEYKVTKIKRLSQPKQFACKETVTIRVGEKKIEHVRVIGPNRKRTQIEISKTDARTLKIEVPLRVSGDLENTPGCTIVGPKGAINLGEGLIMAKRHLHLSEAEAKELNLKPGQLVSVKIPGPRSLTFHNIVTRIEPSFRAAVQVDTDEGNAAGIDEKTEGLLLP